MQMGDRVILHSDINCCYASIEHLHHPELAGKPLAVGGDPEARHGIVLTADYIAKKYGVKTGMALWQAKEVCPDITFVSPRMDLYLATVEGNQPRVRTFGTAHIFEGKLDIQTGKVKDISKQIHANPKVEICAFKNGEWLRVAGELVEDNRREARQSVLDAYPSLQNMYSADDGNTEVFYFKNTTATFSAFTHKPEVVKF